MSRPDLIEEIKRLRDLKYTWRQVQEALFQDGSAPSVPTLMRWARGKGQVYYKTLRIPDENKDEIREVFIRQLKSMGFNSSEIKRELKKLIP